MSSSDPLRIHLSLVSHTNIGKTTLARTLLSRDIGDIADRAHVTETTDDYVLARDSAGCELILWDTPGFGNSVALAKRLAERKNPIGWFMSEVWDRLTNKAFWLDQRAVRHIRDTSTVVLYLVNASELPSKAPYVPAEMQILSWINKPVIVLLNQMGKPRPPAEEAADVITWKDALKDYSFVKEILPMDAFARCWVQEVALFDAIAQALPPEIDATFESLRAVWTRGRRAIYQSSVDAIANHLWRLVCAQETAPTQTMKDHVMTLARRFGLLKHDRSAPIADAQTALSSCAADSLCTLTNKLIEINGLRGSGVSKEILNRLKTDWEVASHRIDPTSAATVSAVGVGAASGVATDLATGGLSLGLGTLLGTLIGAIGGAGAAVIYNAKSGKEGIDISWSNSALESFTLEAILLYLAVAHFGRGRGEWTEGESPEFWKETVSASLKESPIPTQELREMDSEAGTSLLAHHLDTILRTIFAKLYQRGV